VFLLIVTRSIAPDENALPRLQPYLSCMLVICIITFLFYKLPKYVYRYPLESNGGYLKGEIEKNGHQKRLVFLDKNIQNNFVSWNDPFLSEPVIIVRDYGKRNPEAMKYFPDYKPAFYRMQIGYEKKKLNAAFKFYDKPSDHPPGYISSFELAMTMQAANDYWTKDCFDITYTDFFNAEESADNLAFLASEEQKLPPTKRYKDHFHEALIHSARMLLLPKLAFEERGLEWFSVFDPNKFRREYFAAMRSLEESGDVGKSILKQLGKVQRRIDRDHDGTMADEELNRYLTEKIRIFFMGG
jgi:Ca2+-binding EF-hand superfamily protein